MFSRTERLNAGFLQDDADLPTQPRGVDQA